MKTLGIDASIDDIAAFQARPCGACGHRADEHWHLFGSQRYLCPTVATFTEVEAAVLRVPEAQQAPTRFDLLDDPTRGLHAVLTRFGLASRTDFMPLVTALITWAADACRSTQPQADPSSCATVPLNQNEQAWNDLLADGGLPESQVRVPEAASGPVSDEALLVNFIDYHAKDRTFRDALISLAACLTSAGLIGGYVDVPSRESAIRAIQYIRRRLEPPSAVLPVPAVPQQERLNDGADTCQACGHPEYTHNLTGLGECYFNFGAGLCQCREFVAIPAVPPEPAPRHQNDDEEKTVARVPEPSRFDGEQHAKSATGDK